MNDEFDFDLILDEVNTENLMEKKHVELKEICASLELPTYGTKQDMADRILEYYEDEWGNVLEANSTINFVEESEDDSAEGKRV